MANYTITSTAENETKISFSGSLHYDYNTDALNGDVNEMDGSKEYEFSLSPTLTWDSLE